MAKINDTTEYAHTTPALTDHVIGTDVSNTTNDASGETVTFLFSAVKTLIVPEATAAEYRNNTADKILTTDIVWSAMAEITLSDAASIAWDMDTGIDFTVTLAGNRTLANATNTQVGKKGRIRVVQDATGSRTLSYGTSYEFAAGTAPTLTTTASAEDVLFYDCISSTRIIITSVLDIS